MSRSERINSKVLAAAMGLSTLMTFSPVRADVYCSGMVSEHLVYSDGSLMIQSSWNPGWIILCSTTAPWKGVSTEACYSWIALVTAARAQNKPVGVYYTVDAQCSSFPSYYGAPGPLYVRIGS